MRHEWRSVARFVEPDSFAAGQDERREQAPTSIANRAIGFDAVLGELRDHGRDVVAHQVELMLRVAIGRMHRDFGWWCREDRPAFAGIDRSQLQHVGEKVAHLSA